MESIGACWLEYSLSPWGSLSRICAYSGNMQSFCGTGWYDIQQSLFSELDVAEETLQNQS